MKNFVFELTSAASWNLYWTEGESLEDCYGFNRGVQAFVIELSAAKQMCPIELVDDVLPHIIGAIKVRTLTGTKMDKPVATSLKHECHEADVISHNENLQRELSALKASSRRSVITKEDLAYRWFTGLESAESTLKATTQEGMRFVEGDLERHLRTSQAHLRFPTLNLQLYTDTLFSSKRSVRGYTCVQIFTNGRIFFRVYPLLVREMPIMLLLHLFRRLEYRGTV
jgi:hypothetical protein